MTRTLRIGIAGTGRIADVLAQCARFAPEVLVTAVSSRERDRAVSFAQRHGIERPVEGNDELAALDDVDLVYVASLNPQHHADVLHFLAAGKHVLCEKPFALDEAQAGEMIAAARHTDRFMMDALWSRFLPSWQRVRALVDSGAIGEPRVASAELGFVAADEPDSRLLDRGKGGGVLLDAAVYPLAFISWFLGEPEMIQAMGTIGSTGVDVQTVATLGYRSGAHAHIRASFRAQLASVAFLAGAEGVLELCPRMHRATRIVLRRPGAVDLVEELPYDSHGLQFQLSHVAECIAAGHRQSPVMPLDETRAILRTMDTIRAQIGMRYDLGDVSAK